MIDFVKHMKEVTRVSDDDSFFPSGTIKGSRVARYTQFTFTRGNNLFAPTPSAPEIPGTPETPGTPSSPGTPAEPEAPLRTGAMNQANRFAKTISYFLNIPLPPPLSAAGDGLTVINEDLTVTYTTAALPESASDPTDINATLHQKAGF